MRRLAYELGRVLVALACGAIMELALVSFLCPVLVEESWGRLSWDAGRFTPLWRRGNQRLDWDWVWFEILFAGAAAFFVWFVFPHFKPPSPPR